MDGELEAVEPMAGWCLTEVLPLLSDFFVVFVIGY
uniref:Uncharacterized protein n=1 Tax=Rhizophora mucronata TaxID=61149 RepID=A0A2P2Q5L6_RHIMU